MHELVDIVQEMFWSEKWAIKKFISVYRKVLNKLVEEK